MPTSVLRHTVGLRRPHFNYGAFVSSPWASFGLREVSGVQAAVAITPGVIGTGYSAWTEIHAAAAVDADVIAVGFYAGRESGVATGTAIEVGLTATPAAALFTLMGGAADPLGGPQKYAIPVAVPSGNSVTCRITCEDATPTAVGVSCGLYRFPPSSGLRSPSSIDTIGLSGTSGVAVTASDTWTEIEDATTRAYQGLVFSGGLRDSALTAVTENTRDLGVGAAAAETLIYRERANHTNAEEERAPHVQAPMSRLASGHFPVGTRIAARTSTASNATMHVVVLGIPYT